MARDKRRRRRFALMLAAIVLVVCVGGAELVARIIVGRGDNGMLLLGGVALTPYAPTADMVREWTQRQAGDYVAVDAELGWTVVPNAKTRGYTTNRHGARSTRDYAAEPPEGITRVVAFGDSFTHCDDVADDETWQHYIEDKDATFEVLNFGVPGYGTDQALLRWRRKGPGSKPHIAVLGVWPENICRNLNRIRYYLVPTGGFSPKPRFVLVAGQLELVPSPRLDELPGMFESIRQGGSLDHEYWLVPAEVSLGGLRSSRAWALLDGVYRMYQRKQVRRQLYDGSIPDGNAITVAICRAFADEAKELGIKPLILLIPMRSQLGTFTAESPLPLVGELRAAGLDVLDATGGIEANLADAMYLPGGHMAGPGNRVVGAALLEQLRTMR